MSADTAEQAVDLATPSSAPVRYPFPGRDSAPQKSQRLHSRCVEPPGPPWQARESPTAVLLRLWSSAGTEDRPSAPGLAESVDDRADSPSEPKGAEQLRFLGLAAIWQ